MTSLNGFNRYEQLYSSVLYKDNAMDNLTSLISRVI